MSSSAGADVFSHLLDGIAERRAVLVGAQPPQEPPDPARAIVAQVGIEAATKLGHGHSLPVPAVEEFALKAPEEPFAGGIVGAAALG